MRIRQLPQEAVACSEGFAQALNDGDLEAAAGYLYGQPDLGVGTVPADPESALVWDAFRGSIAFSFTGNCRADQSGLVRTGSIALLDTASVTEKLQERAQSLLNQKIAAAGDPAEVYDADNRIREELVTEALGQALQQSLAQDAKTVTQEVTLKLINHDGRWWVVPDQTLLQALSGLT